MSREEGYNGHTVVISFFLGTIAGAAAVLLLAPQARKESAERIREFGQEMKERASDYLDEAKDTVSSTVGRGRDFLDEKRSLIQSAVEAGKEAFSAGEKQGGTRGLSGIPLLEPRESRDPGTANRERGGQPHRARGIDTTAEHKEQADQHGLEARLAKTRGAYRRRWALFS